VRIPYSDVGHGARVRRAARTSGRRRTPKHFVANVGEGGATAIPSMSAIACWRRLFYPPFDAAIHGAGARPS
jgi:hypothetical protein